MRSTTAAVVKAFDIVNFFPAAWSTLTFGESRVLRLAAVSGMDNYSGCRNWCSDFCARTSSGCLARFCSAPRLLAADESLSRMDNEPMALSHNLLLTPKTRQEDCVTI